MTTSRRIGHIASKAAKLTNKAGITIEEIREMGTSLLWQREDISTRPPHTPKPSSRRRQTSK